MSEMPGQRELLNVCFSCLRYSRMGTSGFPLVRPVQASNAFLVGKPQCGQCLHTAPNLRQEANKEKANSQQELETNPFFEKYKSKLKHLADSDPDEFQHRMEQLVGEKKPAQPPHVPPPGPSQASAPSQQAFPRPPTYTNAKGLDAVMKVELIQDKSAEEIEQIWKEYHKHKEGVFAVLKKDDFADLMTKAKKCPTFIFPLARNEGFEFMLMQFDGASAQFTSLSLYQVLKENAPACMWINHFSELMETKGIVLMSGQYDENVLKREEALMLVQLMAIYYGKNSPRFNHVETFNHQPDNFDFNILIEDYKNMYSESAKSDTKPEIQ